MEPRTGSGEARATRFRCLPNGTGDLEPRGGGAWTGSGARAPVIATVEGRGTIRLPLLSGGGLMAKCDPTSLMARLVARDRGIAFPMSPLAALPRLAMPSSSVLLSAAINDTTPLLWGGGVAGVKTAADDALAVVPCTLLPFLNSSSISGGSSMVSSSLLSTLSSRDAFAVPFGRRGSATGGGFESMSISPFLR